LHAAPDRHSVGALPIFIVSNITAPSRGSVKVFALKLEFIVLMPKSATPKGDAFLTKHASREA